MQKLWIVLCSVAILACRVSSAGVLSNSNIIDERSFTTPASVSQLESRAGVKLTILPLGASIVFGHSATDGNGFRLGLESALVAKGYDVDMVGTRHGGTMLDNECEGWSGFRIEEVAAKFDLALPVIAPPNIVLIHVGNNDLTQNFKVATMHERISRLVDRISVALPSALVIVSTLLPNRNFEAGVETYNANLRRVVDAQSNKGRHVYLADVHTSEFTLSDILPDGTHPNDAGYAKMARVFASKVEEVAGQLGTSNPTTSLIETTSLPPSPPPTSSTTPPPPPSSTSSSPPPPSPTSTSLEVSSTLGSSTTSSTLLSPTSSTSSTTEPSTTSSSATSSSTVTTISKTVSESTTSLSTIVNVAASTTGPAPTASTSAPAKNGAESCFGSANLGPTEGFTFRQILVAMACAIPLLAI